ncbi:hypothetical protein ACFCXT_10595 [Streptomyces vinaceus]|uniref:hypothetical protein n=1 Tax=Streptomyces vinaceus TaxID=1960 RepID=UPI0035D6CF73
MLENSVQDAEATRGEPATVYRFPGKKEATAKMTSGTAGGVTRKPAAKKAPLKRKPCRSG